MGYKGLHISQTCFPDVISNFVCVGTLKLQKLAKAVDAKSKIDVCSGGGSEVALMVVSDPEKTGVRFRLDREKTLKDVRKEIGDEKYSKNKGIDYTH